MKNNKKYIYDEDGDKLIEDNLDDVKPNWVEDDIMAEEQINKIPDNYIRGKINSKTPFNKQSELKSPEIIKLELLRELTEWIINRGRSTITKIDLFDWIDLKKSEINRKINNDK